MNALVLLVALSGQGQVDFQIKGDVVQVVKKAPFVIEVTTKGDLFFWNLPKGFKATESGSKLTVETAPVGEHKLRVKIVTIDWENKKLQQTDGVIPLIIGQLPNPPPNPDDPDGEEGDSPFPSSGFAVLILKEASQTGSLPVSQVAIFTSAKVHSYCASKAVRLSDGHPFYRQWDDDYTDSQLGNVPPQLRDAYMRVKNSAKSLPWIAISNGKTGYSGPLPTTVDGTLALLKKWGG